jgi:penicillin-binding protein A
LAERRRIFGLLIAALLVLCGLLAGVAWLPLAQARAKWRDGKTDEAIKHAEEWRRLKLWRSQYHQLLAAAHLSAGRRADAEKYLDALQHGWLWIPVVKKDEVARRLFRRGAYADFLAYDKASRERYESDDVPLYRAAALAAVGRIAEAEAALRNTDKKNPKLAKAIADRKSGTWPYVVDRHGAPVAVFNGDVRAVDKNFEALIEDDAGALTIEANSRRLGVHDSIELTLDREVQAAAMRALGEFRASLVAIDPKTNEVLAIASTGGKNRALEEQYEPGSVIKTLTAASGVKVAFPYDCGGALPIDGRSFGDWKEDGHGALPDFEEAMAQSCNVVFADIGVRAGREKLMALHKRAGFDSDVDIGLFKVPLGRTVGELFNNFETAFYAIGLEHETTTTFHLAMLAAMFANRGAMTTPRVFKARRSMLGEVSSEPPKQETVQVLPRETAEMVIASMRAVVEREHGTGRRAKVAGITMAIKTGTAGERPGFNSLIVGFAPADNPRIAFALIAEDAGPAEFAAAKIAHDFVASVILSRADDEGSSAGR